tara:strand:+ start:1320 stop:1595 length:276 start_codon:yes stop_codon:yes gene_type:complete
MTILSTSQLSEDGSFIVEDDEPLELKLDLTPDSPSFPPVDDAITWLENVDWTNVGQKSRKIISQMIMFAMKFSEKSYDFHEWLYNRVNGMK